MKSKSMILIVAAIALFLVAFSSAYTIDETRQVVITQFGKVVGDPKTDPGLYFRIPFIQSVNSFPKNILAWDGDPGQIPTLEKTYIWVDTFARWKIVDPIKFFQTVNNTTRALGRLDDIIDPAARNLITSNKLIETVRMSNRDLGGLEEVGGGRSEEGTRRDYSIITGREKITELMMEQAKPKLDKFGIELVDIKIKRINYVEDVRRAVYGRMIAERTSIAEKFRSEGAGEARKIFGEKERDLKKITSGAYKTSQIIKGKADAEATGLFAEAFGIDPEFYSFTKTLEIYNESLDENTSIILSTDSEFLKYLKGVK